MRWSRGRRVPDRRRRGALIAALVMLFLLSAGSPASAAPGGMRFPVPSLEGLRSWLSAPNWGSLPRQAGGSAAGKPHTVPAAKTRAGHGVGHKPGTGRGELAKYAPFHPPAQVGASNARGKGIFDPKTSKLDPSRTTATETWYRNADGSLTRDVAAHPVNYRTASGSWAPIDTTLVRGAAGRFGEKANSLDVSFAGHTGSGAGDTVSVAVTPTESVGFSLRGAATVAGTASGDTVTYPELLPGVTLSERAGPTGEKESLVLASPAAGSSWTFDLATQGLAAALDADGSVLFTDTSGKRVGRIPPAYAYDSKVNPGTGDPATTWAVKYALAKSGAGYALTVTVDPAWLASGDRAYPVTVDPTLTLSTSGTVSTTYVENDATGDFSAATRINSGDCVAVNCGTDIIANSFIQFPTFPTGQGYYASSASLHLFDSWTAVSVGSANCNTSTAFTWSTIHVAPVTQAWTVAGSKAYPGPSYGAAIGSAAPATWNACKNTAASVTTGDWVSVPISDLTYINDWSYNTQPNYGLAVYGDTGTLSWRKYDSDVESSYSPYLSVTYVDQAPQVNTQYPPNGYLAPTLTPELLASASRPSGSTTTTALTYDFVVYDDTGTVVVDSGTQSVGDWTVPAGKLSWGKTYQWTVTASDGTLPSVPRPLESLTTTVPQPVITSALSQSSGSHGFDAATGNYTTSATDADVETAGPKLQLVRDYNARDPRTTGAFGAAWSSVLDARVTEQDDAGGAVVSAVVTYPDGSQIGFGKNTNGTFSPPPGRFAMLAPVVAGGYTLTDKNDTVYSFTTALGSGSYGITSITDAHGHALNFGYTSGQVTTMTSAVSGRALHLSWATPTGAGSAHVSTVTTDPATAGDATSVSTWKYYYSGDRLSSVCDPDQAAACTGAATDTSTKYTYADGSQYQSALLDAGAHSVWTLAEPAGASVAASSVLANEGNDNGTYSNVTLGVPGPIGGTTATAASFNGTSSSVSLPSDLVASASYQSIGLWFKAATTGSSGVLMSYQSAPITNGSTGGNYTPALYIGTSGKLYGEFWTGGAHPIATSAAVTSGWHHVVLSAAGNTQSMYLDGSLVGTLSGTIFAYSQGTTNEYVGAGFWGGRWPDEPHASTTTNTGYASYFDGDIADASFFTRPLVASDVTGLTEAATHTASLLTGITRPSGKNYATVAYDSATARVTSVTDDNGGTWTLHAPTVTGTSDAYRGAVMGSAPAGYYRLGDTAGATNAYSEVNYGSGTYNAVTLGVAGPFTDRTAASFNGTSSYMVMPTTDQVSTGPNSVELWFKMPAGNVNGGVLFDEMAHAITAAQPNGWDPALYVGTDGRLHGLFWIGSTSKTMASPGLVNDGAWHHAVLSASTNSQTLYLDGNSVGTVSGTLSATGVGYMYVGAGECGGTWPFHPTNTLGYFPGSIAEVAFYRSQLSAAEVATHYAAYKSGVSGVSPTQVNTVTDPGGKTLTSKYDALHGNRLISQTDGTGATTSYGYDTAGFDHTVTDADGDVTTTGHDVRGNVVSQTTCQNQAAQQCSTEYYTYYPDDTTAILTTPDPRNDMVTSSRDGRSSSATDNTYATTYNYDASGDRTSFVTPPVAGFPSGRTTTFTYSDGTSAFPAVDSGTVPSGLPMRTVSPGGAVSRVAYFHNGDVAATTDANGLVTRYTYDGLGRVLTKTVQPGDPVGWLRLNQTAGTAVPDASGTGNDATASNVTWSGGVGVFNGTSSSVATSAPVINSAASYTISAWANLSAIPSGTASVVDVAGVNGAAAQLAYSASAGRWVFQTTSADVPAPVTTTVSGTSAPVAGSWSHLVGVYDATGRTMTFYVDGSAVGTATAPSVWSASSKVLLGSAGGSGFFPGSLANVQLYQRALSATEVSTLHAAGSGGSTTVDTTPGGLVTSLVYDHIGQVVSQTDPAVTNRVTGAVHTATTTSQFDADGDLTSQTVADSTAGGDASRTVTNSYDANDQLSSSTDAAGNITSFGHDGYGNLTSQTAADGTVTTSTYDAEGRLLTQALTNYTGDPANPSAARTLTEVSRAYDPAGRLASLTDSMGNVTSYTYTDNGLLATATRTDSTGAHSYQLQALSYDAAGNVVSKVGDNGALTTDTTVDAADRTTQVAVDPHGANRVTTVAYTPDDAVATSTETDPGGWNRTTSYTYDPMGNRTSRSVNLNASGHPVGWWRLNQTTGSTVTDSSGTGNTASATGQTWTGDSASFAGTAGQQIATNGPVLTTTASYSVSAWAKLDAIPTAAEAVVAQDGNVNSAFYLQYESTTGTWSMAYTLADTTTAGSLRAKDTSAPVAGSWYHLVGTFDSSTGTVTLYVNGTAVGTATNSTPFAGSGPLTIGRSMYHNTATSQFQGDISNVQVYQRVLSASEVSTLYSAGRTGGTTASYPAQTTTWNRDVRGLPVSVTDPNGNTTNYSYDEAGHLAVTVDPTVSAESYGSTAVSAHPVTTVGYNAFGEETEQQDPDGNITTTVYDADGRPVSQTQPPYTPPGASTPITATTVWGYDKLGNLASETDPLGKVTNYSYDQLGDVATITTPDTGVTHRVYDTNGDLLSTTDPTGAQTQATYDWLGRRVTATRLERYPSAQSLTTTYSYQAAATNPGGAHLASVTSPAGVVTGYGYDALGETTSVTDGAGNTTTTSYNFLGDPYVATRPDSTSTEYDYNAAEQLTTQKSFDATGALVAKRSATYDAAGNRLSTTDPRGTTTTYTYDATGAITQEVQPVSTTSAITTSFGYDAAGLRTRYTDGRGNDWWTTYTPWGLKASEVEPATATYSTAADSTTTYSYDANARLTSLTLPGGITQTATYDAMGDMLTQAGSGAAAATATRTFGYDLAGRMVSAATANTAGASSNATSESFTYNDRGELLTATGSAGSTTFGYNADGSLTSRADAAGTTSYTYDTAGRLASAADPATGTTVGYGYNTLSQVKSLSYGTGQDTRSFGYDSLHRLTSDTLKSPTGSTVASIGYGYDANGNLTSKTTSGFGTSASNTYSYDLADRLTSWNNGSATVNYSYDATGNRVQVGANVYTYDARDQLTSDGVHSYTYTAAGTLTSQTSAAAGTVATSSDAFGQQQSVGTASYTYDALGRVLVRANSADSSTVSLQYSGMDNLIASDGSFTYSRDAGGGLLGINVAGGTTATGQLAMVDAHTDVVGTFAAAGSALAGSATYDPLGNVVGTATKSGNLGFQSGYTDPGTGQVNMAARWYDPATGQFTSKDTVQVSPLGNSAQANPFAYVGDNPMGDIDPSGHCSWLSWSCDVNRAKSVGRAVVSVATSAYNFVSSTASAAYDVAERDFMQPLRRAYNTYVAPVVKAVTHAATVLVHKVKDAYHGTTRWLRHQAHRVYRAARRVYRTARYVVHAAVHVVKSAYHAAHRVVHAAVHLAKAAGHAVAKVAQTSAAFIKHHAAAIASFALSTAAFLGCEAVVGIPTAGVGAVAGVAACSAVAGAVGSLVDQGSRCISGQAGACSVGSFAQAALVGGAIGGVTGALGPVGGKLLGKLAPKALDAVGGLFGRGASETAGNAAARGESRAVTSTAESAADNPGEAAASLERPQAGTESNRASCALPHSFTGSTLVRMADGHGKPIKAVKVGDKVADSVPGASGTQTHTVGAVIVTTTDHDFVDVTIASQPSTGGAGTAAPAAGPRLRGRLTRAAATVAAGVALAVGATAPAVAATTLATGSGAAVVGTVTTTWHHPFYDATQQAFVDAHDLVVGDVVQTPTGTATVVGLRSYHAATTTYDLTITGLHTYYVVAGTTPVLVHNNNNPDDCGLAAASARTRAFGSGKPPHVADVTVTREGEVISQETLQSGNMTPEEAILGFPRSSLATHTESRAMRNTSFEPGDQIEISGQYPPCPSCKGAMNKAARETGASVTYNWPDGTWIAGRSRR